MAFNKSLTKIRKKAGISQGQLSLKSKISRPFISQLESGKRSPRIETIHKLAKALGCAPADLMK